MRNVELKCRLLDPERAALLCRQLGARHVATLEQRDTYYETPVGRLKRRECRGRETEWIAYSRSDQPSPRASDYELFDAREAARRYELSTLHSWAVVSKRRELWTSGELRIHLDRVDALGHFLELEALVNERQSEPQARRALEALHKSFGSVLGAPCSQSYSDLIARTSS